MKQQVQQSGASSANTLHHALGPFLAISQFFGILPVTGVRANGPVTHLSFRWRSPAVLMSLLLQCFVAIDLLLALRVVLEHGMNLYTASLLSFTVTCLAAFVVFSVLARNWPALMKQTHRCESVFLQKAYQSRESQHFSCRIRTIGGILLCGMVAEHLSYVGSAVYSNHLQIEACNLTVDFWENYFTRERLHTFSVVKYNVWMVPFVEWIGISMTFAWSFLDIFLTLLSCGFAVRFRQLHWHIACHTKQHMSADFWLEVRQDFMCLTDLLTQYDDKLSGLVLLSCTHNMYFICMKIYFSFQDKGHFANEIYFWFSLMFVLIRVLTMMLSAASVHEAASGILATIYEIPTMFWCSELRRLNEVLTADTIALSGKGFFYLTRRLIFAMAGTIVAYELVLINRVHNEDDDDNVCAARRF